MKNTWKGEQVNCLEEACMDYVRTHQVIGKVLGKFITKFESYGEVVGSVHVGKVSQEDVEVLEGFFQKNYHGKRQISISAKDLTNALSKSRYASIEPKRLLTLYAREEIYSKATIQSIESRKWEEAFEQIIALYEGSIGEQWLHYVQEQHKYGWTYLQTIYKEHGGDILPVIQALQMGCEWVNHFPCRNQEQMYLPVFATRMTKNPHQFDEKNKEGKFLLQLLQWEDENQNRVREKNTIFASLEKQRLYLNAGILRDDISNYVIVSGIRAICKDGNFHQGMDGFLAEGDTVQVPLSVLASWKEVTCPNQELYIVENPSIYAILVEKWKGSKSVLCMNGQPKLSSLIFLDLLKQANVHLLYAGDFDPEGLLIAQKIKQYYGGEFSYWHMEANDYEESKSDNLISESRISSLRMITDEQLQEVVDEMKICKRAGYQEKIIDRYLNNI